MRNNLTDLNAEIDRREKELAVLRAARDLLSLSEGASVTVAVASESSNSNGNGASAPSKRNSGREGTARLLKQFDRKEVATIEAAAHRAGMTVRQAGIGVLVRHGYLRPKRGGYVRTAKEFHA